jgi:hypothetical protein
MIGVVISRRNLMNEPTPKRRPWTIMVYMAGDNGKVFHTSAGPLRLMAEMTSAGYKDLWKMGQVGTTDICAVTCLFDTQQGSYLVEVRKGNGMGNSLVRSMAEINMGDPENLRAFIVRSIEEYPADHYALVLWNHGLGWLDVDIYSQVRSAGAGGVTTKPIFRSTPAKMAGGEKTRPIAFDDSSKDFLDTIDLRWALEEAHTATGVRLDVIGMDACLMAMIEGARELAPFTDYFVASQEVEPMEGWPYPGILKALNKQPGMDGAAFARMVVDEYATSYGGKTRSTDDTVTQSAIATAYTEKTEALAKTLVDALMLDPAPMLRAIAQRAADQSLVFQDRSYRDLGSFAHSLATEAEWSPHRNARAVRAAAQELAEHMLARDAASPVLRVGHAPAYERATGLSVFLPRMLSPTRREEAMQAYRTLLFAQRTGWDRLVEWLL